MGSSLGYRLQFNPNDTYSNSTSWLTEGFLATYGI